MKICNKDGKHLAGWLLLTAASLIATSLRKEMRSLGLDLNLPHIITENVIITLPDFRISEESSSRKISQHWVLWLSTLLLFFLYAMSRCPVWDQISILPINFTFKIMLAMLRKEMWLLTTPLPQIHWNDFPASEVFHRRKLISIPLNLVSFWAAVLSLNQDPASRVPAWEQNMHLR